MEHWRTVNLALIRGSQAIYNVSAGVRATEEDAVRVYAAQLKAQCGVRSTKGDEVRVYAE